MSSDAQVGFRIDWPSVIAVGLLAIACFAIEVFNPFNIAPVWPAAGISYFSSLCFAPISALILFASFKGRDLKESNARAIPPGQFIVVGLGLLVVYGLILDIGYGIWGHSGRGIYSAGHFARALSFVGFGLLAPPLFMAYRRPSLRSGWRRVCMAGAIIACFLACLGLLETVTYILIAVNEQFLSESLEFIVIPILASLGNLGLFGWTIAVAVMYFRDHLNKISYNLIHYVPLVTSIAGISVGILTQLGYAFATRL